MHVFSHHVETYAFDSTSFGLHLGLQILELRYTKTDQS